MKLLVSSGGKLAEVWELIRIPKSLLSESILGSTCIGPYLNVAHHRTTLKYSECAIMAFSPGWS